MKRIILAITILSIAATANAVAWDDCPFGLEDETYPGTCPRYIDTNKDGICDHSQSEPKGKVQDSEIESEAESKITTDNSSPTKFPIFLIISFVLVIFLIFFFRYLVKKKKLSNIQEKIIWNVLLLIFFLPSAVTGIVLLLTTNLGILRELGMTFLQVHDITSLFFMWISVYHIIWHTTYYTKSTKKLFLKQ